MVEKAENAEAVGEKRSPGQGISLTALSEAFAQAMGWRRKIEPSAAVKSAASCAQSPAQTEPAAEVTETLPEPNDQPADEAEDSCPVSPTSILEAMLFVGNRDNQPLTAARAAELMRGVESGEIPTLVDQLNARYRANGCPYEIISEGAGYRMVLRKTFYPLRGKFYGRVREARLSQAAVDVLAIVAYRQPLTAEEVSRLRGTPSAHILNQLVRRQLLQVQRTTGEHRATTFRTTQRFLDLFGLASLDDLPQSEELDK